MDPGVPVRRKGAYATRGPNEAIVRLLYDKWQEQQRKTHGGINYFATTLKRAHDALKSYPLPLANGTEALVIKGIGEKVAQVIDENLPKYLALLAEEDAGNVDHQLAKTASKIIPILGEEAAAYDDPFDIFTDPNDIREENNPTTGRVIYPYSDDEDDRSLQAKGRRGVVVPQARIAAEARARTNLDGPLRPLEQEALDDMFEPPKKKAKVRSTAAYVPKFRTGNWALLVCLFLDCPQNGFLDETTLRNHAERYSNELMWVDPNRPDLIYTAFTGMNRLVDGELVLKELRPKRYGLTPAGRALASQLWNKGKKQFGDGIFAVPGENLPDDDDTEMEEETIPTRNAKRSAARAKASAAPQTASQPNWRYNAPQVDHEPEGLIPVNPFANVDFDFGKILPNLPGIPRGGPKKTSRGAIPPAKHTVARPSNVKVSGGNVKVGGGIAKRGRPPIAKDRPASGNAVHRFENLLRELSDDDDDDDDMRGPPPGSFAANNINNNNHNIPSSRPQSQPQQQTQQQPQQPHVFDLDDDDDDVVHTAHTTSNEFVPVNDLFSRVEYPFAKVIPKMPPMNPRAPIHRPSSSSSSVGGSSSSTTTMMSGSPSQAAQKAGLAAMKRIASLQAQSSSNSSPSPTTSNTTTTSTSNTTTTSTSTTSTRDKVAVVRPTTRGAVMRDSPDELFASNVPYPFPKAIPKLPPFSTLGSTPPSQQHRPLHPIQHQPIQPVYPYHHLHVEQPQQSQQQQPQQMVKPDPAQYLPIIPIDLDEEIIIPSDDDSLEFELELEDSPQKPIQSVSSSSSTIPATVSRTFPSTASSTISSTIMSQPVSRSTPPLLPSNPTSRTNSPLLGVSSAPDPHLATSHHPVFSSSSQPVFSSSQLVLSLSSSGILSQHQRSTIIQERSSLSQPPVSRSNSGNLSTLNRPPPSSSSGILSRTDSGFVRARNNVAVPDFLKDLKHIDLKDSSQLNVPLVAHTINKIAIVVDNREKRTHNKGINQDLFQNNLAELGATVRTRALSLGDFIWVGITDSDQEVVLNSIVERKTINDLTSSIIDTRFTEQKWRLRHSGLSKIYYLCEGSLDPHGMAQARSTLPFDTLQTALAETEFVDLVTVLRAKDYRDSMAMLMAIYKALETQFVNTQVFTSDFPYTHAIKVRHNGVTDVERYERIIVDRADQLCWTYAQFTKHSEKSPDLPLSDLFGKGLLSLFGVSIQKAGVIVSRWKTPENLIRTYRATPKVKDRIKLVADLMYENRRVGDAVGKLVHDSLWGDNTDS